MLARQRAILTGHRHLVPSVPGPVRILLLYDETAQTRFRSPRRRLIANAAAPPLPRSLLTLAIETSCDDTCVAVLEKAGPAATLHFNGKVTADNRAFRGVHPMVSAVSHAATLGGLVREALAFLPEPECASEATTGDVETIAVPKGDGSTAPPALRRKPDFVTVTRGPGMPSSLATGLELAKGLALAWQVPLLGVNHMQAHALTPRLVSALEDGAKAPSPSPSPSPADGKATTSQDLYRPAFPFLSLLVSGGHTMLVHSRSLSDHRILARASAIAIGDMLDKAARAILPPDVAAAGADVMYGRLLERFAFPGAKGNDYDYGYRAPARRADEIARFDSGRGWLLTPPLAETRAMAFDFTGLGSQARRAVETRGEGMDVEERRVLARETMRLAFEHLASRVLFCLGDRHRKGEGAADDSAAENVEMAAIETLVVSGGVASNRFLMHVLRSMLDVRGWEHIRIVAPPPALCTDNAAMIAWAGMEMFEAGWETDLSATVLKKWAIDPSDEGGGILGAKCWIRRSAA